MPTESIHPKAFLTGKRNVKTGLEARSIIISYLEQAPKKTKEICIDSGFSYLKVTYHLRLLARERLVASTGEKRPYTWALTEYGQQRLAA
jgi:predicted transcriptional regulator